MGPQELSAQPNLEVKAINQKQPWLFENGEEVPIEVLKILSAEWDLAIWECYQASYAEPEMRESHITDLELDELDEIETKALFEQTQSLADPFLQERIKRALECLSPRKRNIIESTFWREESERDIAKEHRVSRPTVRVIKLRAFRQLAKQLSNVRD